MQDQTTKVGEINFLEIFSSNPAALVTIMLLLAGMWALYQILKDR